MPPKKTTEPKSDTVQPESLHMPTQFNLKPVTHAELLNGVYSAFSYDKIPQTFYNRMRLNIQRDKPEHVQFILRIHFMSNSRFNFSTFCDTRFSDLSKMQSSLENSTELTSTDMYAWYELNSQHHHKQSDDTTQMKKLVYARNQTLPLTERPNNRLSNIEKKHRRNNKIFAHLSIAHWTSFAAYTHSYFAKNLQSMYTLPLTDVFDTKEDFNKFEKQFVSQKSIAQDIDDDQEREITPRLKSVIDTDGFDKFLLFNQFKLIHQELRIDKKWHRNYVHDPLIQRMLMQIMHHADLQW